MPADVYQHFKEPICVKSSELPLVAGLEEETGLANAKKIHAFRVPHTILSDFNAQVGLKSISTMEMTSIRGHSGPE